EGFKSPDGMRVQPEKTLCYFASAPIPTCTRDNKFDVYGVRVTQAGATEGVVTWCPNPRSPNGCEGVWQNASAPIVASLRAFAAAAEQEITERKRQYA